MTVLICGSPGDGFQIVGLFANSADAQSFAEDYGLKDWWVAGIISPGAFADRLKIDEGGLVGTAERSALPLSGGNGLTPLQRGAQARLWASLLSEFQR